MGSVTWDVYRIKHTHCTLVHTAGVSLAFLLFSLVWLLYGHGMYQYSVEKHYSTRHYGHNVCVWHKSRLVLYIYVLYTSMSIVTVFAAMAVYVHVMGDPLC